MSIDETVETTKRNDGTFIRTAIQIPSLDPMGAGNFSIDILDTHGRFLCRINAFDFGNDSGDVDVIVHVNNYVTSVVHRFNGDIVFQIPLTPSKKTDGDLRVVEVHFDKPEVI